MTLIYIGLGGALGSVGRHLVVQAVDNRLSFDGPWGTLAVNLVGCLLIGILAAVLVDSIPGVENWKLFLLVGLLGGFTTFSSFGLETFALMTSGRAYLALSYVLLSNLGGVLFAWLGHWLGTTFLR